MSDGALCAKCGRPSLADAHHDLEFRASVGLPSHPFAPPASCSCGHPESHHVPVSLGSLVGGWSGCISCFNMTPPQSCEHFWPAPEEATGPTPETRQRVKVTQLREPLSCLKCTRLAAVITARVATRKGEGIYADTPLVTLDQYFMRCPSCGDEWMTPEQASTFEKHLSTETFQAYRGVTFALRSQLEETRRELDAMTFDRDFNQTAARDILAENVKMLGELADMLPGSRWADQFAALRTSLPSSGDDDK